MATVHISKTNTTVTTTKKPAPEPQPALPVARTAPVVPAAPTASPVAPTAPVLPDELDNEAAFHEGNFARDIRRMIKRLNRAAVHYSAPLGAKYGEIAAMLSKLQPPSGITPGQATLKNVKAYSDFVASPEVTVLEVREKLARVQAGDVTFFVKLSHLEQE